MKSNRQPSKSPPKPFTLGLAAFTKISAIEGVRLSAHSRRMFAEFEKKGLSSEQRRTAIAAKHAKKA